MEALNAEAVNLIAINKSLNTEATMNHKISDLNVM